MADSFPSYIRTADGWKPIEMATYAEIIRFIEQADTPIEVIAALRRYLMGFQPDAS